MNETIIAIEMFPMELNVVYLKQIQDLKYCSKGQKKTYSLLFDDISLSIHLQIKSFRYS